MGVILLIDCASRHWTFRIPTQHCGRHAAGWTVDAKDLPELAPHHRLAGSFQSVVTPTGDDVADAVPQVPSVHIVERIDGQCRNLHTFLRLDNGAVEVGLPEVTIDDWMTVVDANSDRLREQNE